MAIDGESMTEEFERIKAVTSPEVAALLEERGIRDEEVRRVIAHGEETGNIFVHPATGRRTASFRPGNTTYWVEYEREDDTFRIIRAYSHRMLILEGFNMPSKKKETADRWCLKCGVPLTLTTIKLTYLEETFAADTPACPSCGRAFVSEEDAIKKMALAEKMLEDK